MKSIILLLVLSITSIAQAKDISYRLVKPRPLGSRDFPTFDGISLSASYELSGENLYFEFTKSGSNEDGVCKALGYEKSLKGSSRGSFFSMSNVVIVNNDGKIISGKSNSKRINKITCLNIVNKLLSRAFLFFPGSSGINSTYPCISKNSITAKSDANMACKALGYDRAFMHTRNKYSSANSCHIINENGEIVGRRTGDTVRKIGCIK